MVQLLDVVNKVQLLYMVGAVYAAASGADNMVICSIYHGCLMQLHVV